MDGTTACNPPLIRSHPAGRAQHYVGRLATNLLGGGQARLDNIAFVAEGGENVSKHRARMAGAPGKLPFCWTPTCSDTDSALVYAIADLSATTSGAYLPRWRIVDMLGKMVSTDFVMAGNAISGFDAYDIAIRNVREQLRFTKQYNEAIVVHWIRCYVWRFNRLIKRSLMWLEGTCRRTPTICSRSSIVRF